MTTNPMSGESHLPTSRVVVLSAFALLSWLVGLMPLMTEAPAHLRRLLAVLALTTTLLGLVWLLRRHRHRTTLIAIVASTFATPAYLLLHPILYDAEFVFALAVIGVSAQWGPVPGLLSAGFSGLAYGLASALLAPHPEMGVEALALTGFLAAAAIIVGLLAQRQESALAAQARLADELEHTYEAALRAVVAALDARDRDTRGHSDRVTALSLATAQAMGLNGDALRQIRWGALLHDVGKIGVPDRILRKPGALTDEEWLEMRRHPRTGYDMLKAIPFFRPSLDIVLHHHERHDGKGYPDGLAGESIPLSARIFAVADAFDAMTSDRPYRRGRPPEDARAEIRALAGSQFDPNVVTSFERLLASQASGWQHQRAGVAGQPAAP